MSKTPCKSCKKGRQPLSGTRAQAIRRLLHRPRPRRQSPRNRARAAAKTPPPPSSLDKRIPDRLKQAINLVHDSMNRVAEGTLSPAACNAVCRCAKTLVDLHRRADEEMDLIHSEETQAAAAQLAGAPAKPDVLEAVDAITAQQDQHRAESLVAQGFAEFTKPSNPDEPPAVVLNDKGRRRFGYHDLDFTQQLLIEVKDQLDDFDGQQAALTVLPETTDLLETMKERVAQTQSRLAGDTAAPFDPLTGQPIAKLPTRVKIKLSRSRYSRCDEAPPEVLAEQLSKIKELMRKTEELYQDEDFKPRWAEAEKHKKDWKETMAYIEVQKKNGLPLATAPATAIGA